MISIPDLPDIPVVPDPLEMFDFSGIIELMLPVIILFFFFITMMILYKKARFLPLITLVFIASLFAWGNALKSDLIPFDDLLPNTFMLVQLIYFLMTLNDYRNAVL